MNTRENQEIALSAFGAGSKADCVPLLKRWIAESAPCDKKELREWLRTHTDTPVVSPKSATVGFGTRIKYHDQHQAGMGRIGRLVSYRGVTFPVMDLEDGEDVHFASEIELVVACEQCGRAAGLRCSRCRTAFYCSADCQAATWSGHKKLCGNRAPFLP
jgi:hypothetical protein